MKVLIIYQDIPEDTFIFYEDVSDEDWAWMRLTHGCFVNATGQPKDSDEACLRLVAWLEDKARIKPVAQSPVIMIEPCRVLVTGFIL